MTRRKYKLIIIICSFVLLCSITMFGVWASVQSQMPVGSSIAFTATGIQGEVYARLSGSVDESATHTLGDVDIYGGSGVANSDKKTVEGNTYYKVASFTYGAGATSIPQKTLIFSFFDKMSENNVVNPDGDITNDPVILEFLILNTGVNAIKFNLSKTALATNVWTFVYDGLGICEFENDYEICSVKFLVKDSATALAGFSADTGASFDLDLLDRNEMQNCVCEYTSGINGSGAGYVANIDVSQSLVIVPDYCNDGTHGQRPVVVVRKSAVVETPSLSKVILPTGLKTIANINISGVDSGIFNNCAELKTINLPSSLVSIVNYSFRACTSLENIVIPISVNSNTGYLLDSCTALVEASVLTQQTSLGTNYFYNCPELRFVTLSNTITSFSLASFRECTSLKSINLPNGLTTIGTNCFRYCSALTEIVIPSSVTSLGTGSAYTFADSGLTSVVFESGSNLTTIPNYCFYNCISLESINLPSGLTTIGTYSFYKCTSLESIHLPSGITTIESYAFNLCANLTTIDIPTTVSEIKNNNFASGNSGGIAYSGLTTVNFQGTSSEWTAITKGSNNQKLTTATINYGQTSLWT